MKKLIISFMSIFMILFIAGFNISQAASLNISASNTKPKIGDTVTVTVRFSQPVTTASFKLNYNNSVLQYSSNTIGGTNSGSSIIVDYIDLVGLKAVSSAKFTFKAKAAGTAKISISGITISDAQGNELSASAGSTTITVTKKETSSTGSNTGANAGNNSNSGSNKNNSNSGSSSNKTEVQPTFKNTNQKMYAKNDVSVRSSYSTSSTKLGTLKKGDSVTRTGVGSNGWDKVTYNGKTAYVLSSYLTTTKPTENNNDEKNVITNSEVKNEENVIENSQINDIINNIENSQLSNNIINSQVENNNVEKRFNNVIYIIIALIIIIAIVIIIKGKRK